MKNIHKCYLKYLPTSLDWAAAKYIFSNTCIDILSQSFFVNNSSHCFGLTCDRLMTSSSISPRALSNSSSRSNSLNLKNYSSQLDLMVHNNSPKSSTKVIDRVIPWKIIFPFRLQIKASGFESISLLLDSFPDHFPKAVRNGET